MPNTKSKLVSVSAEEYELLVFAINNLQIKGENAEMVGSLLKNLKHNEAVMLERRSNSNGVTMSD